MAETDARSLAHDVRVCRFLMGYARTLLADVPDDEITRQPFPGANHPAWILGHVTLAVDNATARLGGQRRLPREWRALFGMGSRPQAERETYPAKDELLRAYEDAYERFIGAATAAEAEALAAPNPVEMLREGLPTLRDLVTHLLISHPSVHFGQLSAWRRALGRDPLF